MINPINKIYQIIALSLVTFIIYFNTLFNDYALDDKAAIYQNEVTKEGINGIKDIFTHYYYYGGLSSNTHTYRPVVSLTHAIEWQIFQRNPAVSHFVNILIYIITIIILYRLLTFLFEKRFPDSVVPFFGTLLFALHPIHTEVVANIKGRDELLAFLFILSGILYFMKKQELTNYKTYLIAGVLFFLALLCKESAVLFLVYLILVLYFFSSYTLVKSIGKSLPFLLVIFIYAVISNYVLGTEIIKDQVVFNVPYIYATPTEAFATKIFVISKYFQLLLFPHPLICDYTYQHIAYINFQDYRFWLSVIFISGLFVLACKHFKRKNIFSFCIFFFFAGISIISNLIIPTTVMMAERSLFVPSLGFCIALAILLELSIKKSSLLNKKSVTLLIYCGFTFVAILYSVKVISRNRNWKDDFHLFTNDVKYAPDCVKLLHLSGYFNYFSNPKINSGELPNDTVRKDCIQKLKRSIQLLPESFPEPYVYLSYIYLSVDSLDLAYDNIDVARRKNMNTQQMLELLNEISKKYMARGDTSFVRSDLERAGIYFHKAALADENNARAWWNYGGVCLEKGNNKEAVTAWEKVIAIDSGYPNAKAFLNIIKMKNDTTQ